MEVDTKKIVYFQYTNYKGESQLRRVIPNEIWFGRSEFHDGEQWFLRALDLDKSDFRNFAMKEIKEWKREVL